MDVSPYAGARELAEAVRTGRVRSRDLVELYLGRIDDHNGSLNAVVTVDAEGARRTADECDAAVKAGSPLGPLHGVPVTVKDAYATAGIRTTAGLDDLAHHVPDRDALAVGRYRGAGAVLLGKTNVPAGITGQETANSLFGRTVNPWDPRRTPGGSSGGAAAALAAGLTALELGSDSGGSLRQPAHCCGIFAHMPTHGTVPLRGHLPQVPPDEVGKDIDLMGAGPLSRTAHDLALALGVLAGPDPAEQPGWSLRLPGPVDRPLETLRIGVWLDDPDCPTDQSVLDRLEAVVEASERAGALIDRTVRPAFALADAFHVAFALWVASSAERTPDDQTAELAREARTSGGRHDLAAQRARAEAMTHRDWQLLDAERRTLRRAWDDALEAVDVLICPVSPVVAVPHDPDPKSVDSVDARLARSVVVNGRPEPYLSQLTWNIVVGLAGVPATAAPAGVTPDGLPVGFQTVGARGSDLATISAAGRLSALVGGAVPAPGWGP